MTRCSLAIADDHELVARGLANLLAPFYEIVGVVHSGRELLELLGKGPVDCVLLDLSMPDQSGLEVLPQLKQGYPASKVIMVTMHADRWLVQESLRRGADGYITKDDGIAEVREAIDAVLSGKQFVSARVPKHTDRTSLHALHPSMASLTPQQEKILLLLGEGLSSAAMGKAIGLTEATVAFHRANLRRKLGIDSELGLHRFAVLVRTFLPASPDGAGSPRSKGRLQ
ncbi:MAG TPA: response regulator transcription factor [Gemmatimonadales bacterium]|nr:response regulator transcription factor [Gemmatimonadales bacterium]